ncbi:universal stress protein [Streptomyces chattanoogensis]|uniref:universal stress protein n=1 Tax=Streptomyces chattanoogensis TaxID=66876 RepID=UPI0006B59B7F
MVQSDDFPVPPSGTRGRTLDHEQISDVPSWSAVLLDAARDAGLLVVGSRGHGGFSGALLGSVGRHCTQHAPRPVVVVRGRDH